MSYPRLARILYNNPLLIEPGKAELIERIFRQYVEGSGDAAIDAEAPHLGRSKLFSDASVSSALDGAGYYLAEGGIAVVPVLGTLVQRSMGMDALSGLQSYASIQDAINAALADTKVRGILMEIDSPGGDAAGLFDLAAQIREASQKKPVWAAANEYAFSAAYAIGASADRLSLPESGSVGSVGVIMMHVDQSAADQRKGYKFTPIFAGARKADFSTHAPLGAEAKATAQQQVDALYEMFVSSVAQGRNIDASVPRGTEAGLLNSQQAKTLGMADAVEPFRHTLAQFRDHLNARARGYPTQPIRKGSAMANPTDTSTAPAATTEDAARAAATKAAADAGVAATARVKTILSHAEAANRRKLAEHLAFNTTMSADEAATILAASEKEAAIAAPATPQNKLDEAMRAAGNKKIDADPPPTDAKKKPVVASTQEVFAKRRADAEAQRRVLRGA